MLLHRHVRLVSALIVFRLAGLASASADDGTAHNGPHIVPGVIRAIDFNDGAPFVAYYAATPGNQGGYSAYRPDTDVDIALGPAGPYVVASRGELDYNDWLKYSIEVSRAGWFRVDYFARVIAPAPSTNILTLVDDRPLGDTTPAVPVQDDFADLASRGFYLGAGRHTLGVLFRTQAVALDRIKLTSVVAPLTLKPRVVSTATPSTEVVVADAVVTDWPFLADPTGKRDSTQAFADALAIVSAYGGGTVFAPAGSYRIDGTISIPESTTLRGADSRDRSDPSRIGTLLLASFGEGDPTAAPFISLHGLACVRDLSIWYPSQGFTNDTVRSYPFTVFLNASDSALNLRLYDSYDGIRTQVGNHQLADIVGTVLHTGLIAGTGFEFSWLSNVRFGNETWKSAPAKITNAPRSDGDRLALDTYTSSHVLGAQIGTNTYGMYGLEVRNAQRGMLVKKVPGDPVGFASVISKIDAPIEDIDGYVVADLHFLDTDNVPGTETLGYDFPGFRSPSNATNFSNVKDRPFGAAGDGRGDDTEPIQAALDAMGRLGGGTVYLPQGQYRVAHLTVPTGVELRGPLGGDVHGSIFAVCTLLGYEGRNTGSPDSDPALLTLSPRSGIRGFDIAYPEQGYGSPVAPVVPYPFTIRGTGSGVWVENVTVADAFNLIDFATFRCDDHFASGVEAAVLNTGVVAGGGSEHGRLERMLISRGMYGGQRLFGPPGPAAQQSLVEYMRQNTVPFAFGNCFQETTFGLDSFDVKIGWRMLADGGGCTDSTFWQPSSDTTSQSGYLFEGGDNLRFVGVEAGSSLGTSFVSSASFAGSVDVYGTMSWGNARNRDLSGGVFRFHNERSLTLGKTATASSAASPGEGPSNAVDGSEFTKWVSAAGGTNWLQVDLNQTSEIDRWVVRHAGTNAEPENLDTSSFAIQVSDDGVTFSNADSVAYNGSRLTDRPIAARGRYVRLLVTQGTQYGSDGLARIYEFAAYGKEGWPFTKDSEGWTPGADVASFAVQDGGLEVAPAGGQLTISSRDNLNIQASLFSRVAVRMKGAGGPASAKLSFMTQGDPTFSDSKSVTVGVGTNTDYADYTFDFSGNAEWVGAIKQLRLTLVGMTGASIESIAFSGVIDPGFAVTGISPASGPAAGGTKITIGGTLFQNDAGVEIGEAAATSALVTDGMLATAVTPALSPGTLSDVIVINPDTSTAILPKAWLADFSDVPPSEQFHNAIERVFRAGITSGCVAGGYCPADTVSRAQMGIFIARVLAGGGANIPGSGNANGKPYNCTAGGRSAFDDVLPTDIFCKHVHYLATEKVTLGCTPTSYCPTLGVLRQDMAAFIAKGIEAPAGGSAVPLTYGPDSVTGRSYSCDAASPNLNFTDVLVSDVFCKHVHFLWAKGIIAGCGAATYCPTGEVTRDQMAKFLVNAFNLTTGGR